MTIEINEQTDSNSYIRAIINQYNRCRIWIRCPQCIGGSMYHEGNGEYVCMQCGCSYYPDKVAKIPIIDKATEDNESIKN